MEKIKLFLESQKGKDIMTVLIVIFVGLASFGLGRLSVNDNKGGALEVDLSDSPKPALKSDLEPIMGTNSTKQYFASSKGKKYYTVNCSAGGTIKEENKVWFTSKEDAEKAGYTLSTSCY